MNKKLTIYIKTSQPTDKYFHKFEIDCHCGQCVLPECAKCKNCSECNVVDFLRRHDMTVEYKTNTPDNRTATITVQNIRALGHAYKHVCKAKNLCQCDSKQKTK